jgi:hypothetical protein
MHRKSNLSLLAAVLTSAGLTFSLPAVAGSETEAVIGKLGLGCKNRVLEQFDVPNSDITVRLGATLQQDIDSGAMTVADLEKDGASFNWEVSGKNASGYCNVDGSGTITEFKQW